MNVPPSTIYAFGFTVWGVIHLLVGLALLVIGIALLRGQTWGRVAGMFAAAVSAIINFVWLPYSPLWAIMVIAVDILIIWALASYLRQPTGAPQDSQATVPNLPAGRPESAHDSCRVAFEADTAAIFLGNIAAAMRPNTPTTARAAIASP